MKCDSAVTWSLAFASLAFSVSKTNQGSMRGRKVWNFYLMMAGTMGNLCLVANEQFVFETRLASSLLLCIK